MRRVLTLMGPREFGGWNKEADLALETGWSCQGSGEELGGCPALEAKGRKSFREERGSGRCVYATQGPKSVWTELSWELITQWSQLTWGGVKD